MRLSPYAQKIYLGHRRGTNQILMEGLETESHILYKTYPIQIFDESMALLFIIHLPEQIHWLKRN